MPAEHAPLGGRDFLSPKKQDWFRQPVRDGLSRCAALANVLSSMPRPTKPEQTMWDSLYINLKFHDREPEAIVNALEKKWPNFFDGMPSNGPITLDKKKELIGEWGRSHVRLGMSAYGKPNLRKKDGPTSDLDQVA